MSDLIRKARSETDQGHEYEPLLSSPCPGKPPSTADVPRSTLPIVDRRLSGFRSSRRRYLFVIGVVVISPLLCWFWALRAKSPPTTQSCDSFDLGFQCQPEISHFWGQYSPYFSVRGPSQIATDVPDQCQITFAQILSRHGARDPTLTKTLKYMQIIESLHTNALSYSKPYLFLKDYKYTLGADELTIFGQQQMVNSGIKFYKRYQSLALHTTPFIRASGQNRVVESAQNWTQGFHTSLIQDDPSKPDGYPYPMLVIPETKGSNNTLSHGLCTSFEDGSDPTGEDAQNSWMEIFAPPIAARLMDNLPGTNFTIEDTVYMMDLCPFNTIASDRGKISPFCALFTESEWRAYDYYQSLGKYYGYSWGNALGPTQGVGFTNELIARLTNTPVNDHTSTNSTLDSSRDTFPLGGNTTLYADFSHDNDMITIFSALGLYNSTKSLSNTTIEDVEQTNGYSASWTGPFAARAYFEKMTCANADEEFVRVIVNDRVLPLETCGGDDLGRCTLKAFVDSLSFAKQGGDWDKCFI